jgi:hypothetical protein
VIAPFIDYQWDADTAVMKSFAKTTTDTSSDEFDDGIGNGRVWTSVS